MHNFKKLLPKIILVLILLIVILIVFLSLNDIQEIGKVLKEVKLGWLFAGIGFLFLYMLFYPLSLYLLGRSKTLKSVSFPDAMMIGSMEYFFNGITPFSAGGQPFQIYAYSQIDVPPHRSSGIILMNFVATQLSIVLLCLASLFYYEKLTMNLVYLKVMIWIGLAMNIFILGLFVSVGVSKTLRNLLTRFVRWFLNLKLFKGKLSKYVEGFENYCDGAQSTFKSLSKEKLKFVNCVLLKLVAFILYYMIPFFILKALSIEIGVADLALITAMTTFSIAMTCYIPTPGAAGGIEFAFQSLFVTILPSISSSVAASGVLLWRFITYYLLMLISFIIYLIFEGLVKKRNNIKQNEAEAEQEEA